MSEDITDMTPCNTADAKLYRGEAGSPGSPGQGRGDFFLARGLMFPGFPHWAQGAT